MKLKQLHESAIEKSIATVLENNPHYEFLMDGGNFSCCMLNLNSLEGSPVVINGHFVCWINDLKSLKFAPRIVKGYFSCANNKLESLEFAPEIVEGNFDCSQNPEIKSLKNIHKQIKSIKGTFSARKNLQLNNHLLGLILIDGITKITLHDEKINAIMNRHLMQTNKKVAMLRCQQELIEAGYEEAAQL